MTQSLVLRHEGGEDRSAPLVPEDGVRGGERSGAEAFDSFICLLVIVIKIERGANRGGGGRKPEEVVSAQSIIVGVVGLEVSEGALRHSASFFE